MRGALAAHLVMLNNFFVETGVGKSDPGRVEPQGVLKKIMTGKKFSRPNKRIIF